MMATPLLFYVLIRLNENQKFGKWKILWLSIFRLRKPPLELQDLDVWNEKLLIEKELERRRHRDSEELAKTEDKGIVIRRL